MQPLHPVAGLMEHTTENFRLKLIALAGRIGADPTALAAVMSFETGRTFRADIQNPSSGATGLIQFMPSTARGLGTTTNALARLSPEAQLPWVEKYFRWNGTAGKFETVADHYMAVFAPAKIGTPGTTVLYREPSQAYRLNKALDRSKDGTITKDEAAAHVIALYNQARALAPVGKEDRPDPLGPFPDRPESPSLADVRDELLDALADLRLVVESRCDELDGRLNGIEEATLALEASIDRKA